MGKAAVSKRTATSKARDPLVRPSPAAELLAQNEELKAANEWLRREVNRLQAAYQELEQSKRAADSLAYSGTMAAAALERRLEERTRQIKGLAFELTRAEEKERQAIACDLRDELGQLLAVARLRIGKLRAGDGQADLQDAIAEVDDLVVRAEQSICSLGLQLSPAVLHERGLIPALQWLAEEMKKTYGLSVELSDDEAPKPLGPVARAILFRAIRELLINVIKHAGVSTARVVAACSGDRIEVVVSDRGAGFDLDRTGPEGSGSFGLSGMRERLSLIGGSVKVLSRKGSGTEIILTGPLLPPQTAMDP
jgi:two-component system, chemotaxis family, CheB/CheR fusion protein